MKYFEFLDEFAKVAHGFDLVDDNARIRCGNMCPITLVCEKLKGIYYGMGEVSQASATLDLDPVITAEIVAAADNRQGDHFSARTRRDLTELIEKGKLIRGTKGK